MKHFFALFTFAIFTNAAYASDSTCLSKADTALAKVAQALGMGKGVGHIGGSEITNKVKDSSGNWILTITGGALATSDSDGYLSGTGATVEMIQTKTDCFVNKISVTTGADFHTTVE